MAKRFVDKEHQDWIRRQPCIIKQAGFYSCNGAVQGHHLLKPWDGERGMSLRSNDKNLLPLCAHHHMELHTQHGSEKSFFKKFGLPENYGKEMARMLYEKHLNEPEISDDIPF